MCSGDKILTELKGRQVKQKALRCTAQPGCWCFGLQTKIAHEQDDCLSPQNILDLGMNLPQSDRAYLQGLVGREFVL